MPIIISLFNSVFLVTVSLFLRLVNNGSFEFWRELRLSATQVGPWLVILVGPTCRRDTERVNSGITD
jgi:hypothetical protein